MDRTIICSMGAFALGALLLGAHPSNAIAAERSSKAPAVRTVGSAEQTSGQEEGDTETEGGGERLRAGARCPCAHGRASLRGGQAGRAPGCLAGGVPGRTGGASCACRFVNHDA